MLNDYLTSKYVKLNEQIWPLFLFFSFSDGLEFVFFLYFLEYFYFIFSYTFILDTVFDKRK